MPIIVVEEILCLCVERSDFVHSRYDKVDVLDDGILVFAHYTLALSLMVTLRGNNLGEKWIVRILYHFSN